MAKNKMSDLRNHLFECLERIKCNEDPDASENEKMSIETVNAVVDISQQLIESWKVETQAAAILSKCANPTMMANALHQSGLIETELKEIGTR